MDRLISEQAVLNVINRYGTDELRIKAIKAIPSAESKWIPVSERLPETNDDVLVTDGVDMFVAWYSRKGMWQGWKSSDNNFERNTPIDAWMPLPKPYEPQERSDKE